MQLMQDKSHEIRKEDSSSNTLMQPTSGISLKPSRWSHWSLMFNFTVIKLIYFIKFIKKNQLHAVSRTQQGRQRESSVKTLRSPLSAEFWRHCALSGRTQRRA